ncbi:MAG: FkbM family methyltransferase [Cyanobacteria bacterium]|nr:FkbM family methyltransferase [Cyanobacteriota bacterium]MDW8200966.1 FkbM family methyltransferase [Cyanobacteriota bacterium SKYGB_h_bin112]
MDIKYRLIIQHRLRQLPILQEIDRLRASPRYQDPKCLIPFGAKVYSQSDEDGIIREIFRRIGTTNKLFVEFGVGNGLENNTLALLFDGWKGLWIDAAPRSIATIRQQFANLLDAGILKVVQSLITVDNINTLIADNIAHPEVDLLSVDIDGNDFHVLNAITCISPRVIVVEYNAKFSPPLLFCMEYDATHTWQRDDCFGASLKFLEVHLAKKGYRLVGCNLSGVNAFFVRQDLVADKFLEPFTAEQHYEPPRYYLSGYFAGHPPAYKTLVKSLAMQSA